MSKVLVTKAKVDTIADKITALVDDTSKKTLDEMATSLNGVGLEVAEQEDLIAQIKSTVDSLPEAGGSGGSSTTQQTCTVELDCGATEGYFTYYAVETLENGQWNLQNLRVTGATNLTLSNVICGGLIIFTYADIQILDVSTSSDATLVGSDTNIKIIKAPSTPGSHRIKIYDNF